MSVIYYFLCYIRIFKIRSDLITDLTEFVFVYIGVPTELIISPNVKADPSKRRN